MESNANDVKYQKLASEYSKIRAQAGVLKRAVLEEQHKNSNLRESLRLKETALRRTEQELDSLSFRNKQLEHRVASLQDDFELEAKKREPKSNNSTKNKLSVTNHDTITSMVSEQVFTEELQKKILENAQLTTVVTDKDSEIDMLTTRIQSLEQQLSQTNQSHSETEQKLRKELDSLVVKNNELETKLADGVSMLGSDDTISVTDSDHLITNQQINLSHGTPSHQNAGRRISCLEKELFHWRTQYEMLKMCVGLKAGDDARTMFQKIGSSDPTNQSDNIHPAGAGDIVVSTDELLFEHFSKKLEDMFSDKCMAESRATSYMIECDSLRNNLDIVTNELANTKDMLNESQRNWQLSKEELVTTQINYVEQISVLTEKVISLSDQIALLK